MKLHRGLILLALVFGFHSHVLAGIRPSFSLEACSWRATHIIVVTEGKKIDGVFQILESWQGDLTPGETIKIPAAASVNPNEARSVNRGWDEAFFGERPPYVTGERIVLFLRDAKQVGAEETEDVEDAKTSATPPRWKSANPTGGLEVSMVWIEKGKTYGFQQLVNPGPSLLSQLGLSEAEMRQQIAEILSTRHHLNLSRAIPELTKRAEALRPLVSSTLFPARLDAFAELRKCGEAALPVLRNMLQDDSLIGIHHEVVEALAQVGGKGVAAELTAMIGSELEFWKRTAPALEEGWWNGAGLSSLSEAEPLRIRYMKTLRALEALKKMRYRACEKVVAEFRDFWRLLPQLEDKTGLDGISRACDELLQELQQSSP